MNESSFKLVFHFLNKLCSNLCILEAWWRKIKVIEEFFLYIRGDDMLDGVVIRWPLPSRSSVLYRQVEIDTLINLVLGSLERMFTWMRTWLLLWYWYHNLKYLLLCVTIFPPQTGRLHPVLQKYYDEHQLVCPICQECLDKNRVTTTRGRNFAKKRNILMKHIIL